MEFEWAKYIQNKIHCDDHQQKIIRKTPDPTKYIATTEDETLFPDDTGIAYAQTKDIAIKLKTYDTITQENQILVNRDIVFILTNAKNEKGTQMLKQHSRHIIKLPASLNARYLDTRWNPTAR